ncbi:hypothetical protein C8R44DRAFT_813742 [Mycena epipterygia]|nr:hypothetical protein C8R44DRAFT_813742 [Mycena epipterygia]
MLQGQDFTRHTKRKLTDENFIHRHDRTGLLSKANAGRTLVAVLHHHGSNASRTSSSSCSSLGIGTTAPNSISRHAPRLRRGYERCQNHRGLRQKS